MLIKIVFIQEDWELNSIFRGKLIQVVVGLATWKLPHNTYSPLLKTDKNGFQSIQG